jgi:hypothetical protein
MPIIVILGPPPSDFSERASVLMDLLLQAPYPDGNIITELVGTHFPELPQRDVFEFTQQVKTTIAELEETCKLATALEHITQQPYN